MRRLILRGAGGETREHRLAIGVKPPGGQHRLCRRLGMHVEVAAVQKQVVDADAGKVSAMPGVELILEPEADPAEVAPRSSGRCTCTARRVVLIVRGGCQPFRYPSGLPRCVAHNAAVPTPYRRSPRPRSGTSDGPKAGPPASTRSAGRHRDEQLINLFTDPLRGQYSFRHGCRSPFVSWYLLMGTYARGHLHQPPRPGGRGARAQRWRTRRLLGTSPQAAAPRP